VGLVQEYGIARTTAAKALKMLVDEGWFALDEVTAAYARAVLAVWTAGSLDQLEFAGLDAGSERMPLAAGEGEDWSVRVLRVADGDLVLACRVGEFSDLDAAPA
jgi:hypothetical protein